MDQLAFAVHRGNLSEVRRIVEQNEEIVQHAANLKEVNCEHRYVK